MASSGKRKTTMAKLTRERKLVERRLEKQARKAARKASAADELAQGTDGAPADDLAQDIDTAPAGDQTPEPTDDEATPGDAPLRVP